MSSAPQDMCWLPGWHSLSEPVSSGTEHPWPRNERLPPEPREGAEAQSPKRAGLIRSS